MLRALRARQRHRRGRALCKTAVTGSGDDNPLVVLLREMLGSRLDHLDAQSADFRSQIPL